MRCTFLVFALIMIVLQLASARNLLTVNMNKVESTFYSRMSFQLCGIREFSKTSASDSEIMNVPIMEPFYLSVHRYGNENHLNLHVSDWLLENGGHNPITVHGEFSYVLGTRRSKTLQYSLNGVDNTVQLLIFGSMLNCISVEISMSINDFHTIMQQYSRYLHAVEAQKQLSYISSFPINIDEATADRKLIWTNGFNDVSDPLPISTFQIKSKSNPIYKAIEDQKDRQVVRVSCEYMDRELALEFTSCLNHNRIDGDCNKNLEQGLYQMPIDRLIRFIVCTDQFMMDNHHNLARIVLNKQLKMIHYANEEVSNMLVRSISLAASIYDSDLIIQLSDVLKMIKKKTATTK